MLRLVNETNPIYQLYIYQTLNSVEDRYILRYAKREITICATFSQ